MVVNLETFNGTLSDVRAFCEVVEFGTITAAAKRLGESKGSVSRRITRLEGALGVRLMARTPRSVTPTDEGLAFHLKAQAGMAMLDEASDTARGQREVPRGNLRITTAIDLSVELLPPLITSFRKRYPQITVEIIATDTPIDLAAHRIDLALRIGMGGLPDQAHHGVELMGGSFGLYAAPEWIAQRSASLASTDLKDVDLIVSEKAGPVRITTLKNDQGNTIEIRARAAIRVSDLATALRLAEAGAGIALLPDIILARALSAGTLAPVLPEWKIPGLKLHALTHIGRDVPARVRLFRAHLRETLRAAESQA
jgi:DNA-binding transcriptional LysR family regulator